jgi:hypothetical protein
VSVVRFPLSVFRLPPTASEALAGWSKCHTADAGRGTFGTDSYPQTTEACGNSVCGNAAWAQSNGQAYDYALYLGGSAPN